MKRSMLTGLLALVAFLAAAAGEEQGSGFQETFKNLDRWEVYDGPYLYGKVKKSQWEVTGDKLVQSAYLTMDPWAAKRVKGRFSSIIVTKESYGEGTFRFQVEQVFSRAEYGIVFGLQNPSNYYRGAIGGGGGYRRIQDNAPSDFLPTVVVSNRYIPAQIPSWVDVVFKTNTLKVAINGVTQGIWKTDSVRPGKLGFFSANPDVRFSSVAFYGGEPPPLALRQAAIKKPYIYWCAGDEARIAWETLLPGEKNVIRFSAPGEAEREVAAQKLDLVQAGILNGLKPGAAYRFECFTDGVLMGEGSFRADPGPGQPFRLALIGDNRSNPAQFAKLNDMMLADKPEFVLNTGDIVEGGSRTDWDTEFFTPNARIAAHAPYLVSIGNHEENAKYFSQFLPYPGTHLMRHYYATRYGCMAFLSFDDYHVGDGQYRWMEQTLASPMFQEAAWRVVFCHQPAFSVGWKGYDGDKWKREGPFMQLLAKYKVDFVFNGHTHSYERGLTNGTYHIITGGGGAGGENFGRVWDHVDVFALTLHYCMLDVTPRKIELVSRGIDGRQIDRLVVEKGKPGVLEATPVLASRPADKVAGGPLAFSVKTPALGERKLRYKITGDPAQNTYAWTAPAPASQAVPLEIKPGKTGKYGVRIVGMDEDGRVTLPVTAEVDYTP